MIKEKQSVQNIVSKEGISFQNVWKAQNDMSMWDTEVYLNEFKNNQGEILVKTKLLSELGMIKPDESSEITFGGNLTDL